jgi:hypothetical protein
MLNIYRNMSLYFLLLVLISPLRLKAQTKDYIAIIPPFHIRQNTTGTESPLELRNLQFVIFAYENAIVVYSESDFINQSENVIEQELGLPSTGHNVTGNDPDGRISNGIRSIQLWVQGERVNPQLIKEGDEEWYTIQAKLTPHESRKVKALFWAETSLANINDLPGLDTTVITNGRRIFLIDLAHAAVWKSTIQSIDITVVLKDGIFPSWETFSAGPPSYNLKDSSLTWSMKYIKPSTTDNVLVKYESFDNSDSTKNTIPKLSSFIVKQAYGQLQYFVSQLDKL